MGLQLRWHLYLERWKNRKTDKVKVFQFTLCHLRVFSVTPHPPALLKKYFPPNAVSFLADTWDSWFACTVNWLAKDVFSKYTGSSSSSIDWAKTIHWGGGVTTEKNLDIFSRKPSKWKIQFSWQEANRCEDHTLFKHNISRDNLVCCRKHNVATITEVSGTFGNYDNDRSISC